MTIKCQPARADGDQQALSQPASVFLVAKERKAAAVLHDTG